MFNSDTLECVHGRQDLKGTVLFFYILSLCVSSFLFGSVFPPTPVQSVVWTALMSRGVFGIIHVSRTKR